MNKEQLAKDCIRLVGGKRNIKNCGHCSTRLRLTLKNLDKVDTEGLKKTEGVIDVQQVGTQTQIIIGPDVQDVYKVIAAQLDGQTSSGGDEPDKQKGNLIGRFFDIVTGIFGPIIPVITASAMVKAVLAILVLVGLSTDSQEYYLINMVSDVPFYFFPVLLGFSCGKKFGCNPYMAAVIGGVLLHPNFSSLVSAGEAVTFFSLPVRLVSYSSSVLPIILCAAFMSVVEKFANRISPKYVKSILVPLLTIAITAPVSLIILAPLGNALGSIFGSFINFVDERVYFLPGLLVGTLTPFLVFGGLHYGFTPFTTLSIAEKGYEGIAGPGMLASNMAEGAAALAVSIRSKNPNRKSLAFSSGVTALCGITEPALYGITFKDKRVLISVMIGGGVGGLYAGLTHLVRTALGTTALTTLPVFITENPMNIVHALITVGIAFVITFVLVFFWVKDPDVSDKTEGGDADKAADKESTYSSAAKADDVIVSPLSGTFCPLNEVKDPTFSSEAVGKGCAVIPDSGEVKAPVNGTVVTVFPSQHAIGLKSDKGTEILVHLGLDTVELNGSGFEVCVKSGDRVTAGQLIARMDLEKIAKAGYDTTSPVVVTNSQEYASITCPAGLTHVSFGQELLSCAKEAL